MKKPSEGFLCNESRSSVVNSDLAKFRCNGLLVVSIFDLVSNMELNSILHKSKIRGTRIFTKYKVGSIVKPNYFDRYLENVCGEGIHYFLSVQAAKDYNLKLGYVQSELFPFMMYDENGDYIYK
jgi:hypothetical protein